MQSPALSAACPACPVETTLTLISDKWKVLILRDLMPGTKRFGELKSPSAPSPRRSSPPSCGRWRPADCSPAPSTRRFPPRGVHPHRPGTQPPACSGRHGSLGKSLPRKCPLMRAFSLNGPLLSDQ